jgi:hypothetical protein
MSGIYLGPVTDPHTNHHVSGEESDPEHYEQGLKDLSRAHLCRPLTDELYRSGEECLWRLS